jgi:hypothetical protein
MKSLSSYRNGIYTKTWKDPIYTTKYTLVIVEQQSDILAAYGAITKGEWERGPVEALVAEVVTENVHNVLLMFAQNATPGVIAHEANHALNVTFKYHGTKLDLENDEPQSYHLEHIVEQVHDGFERRILKMSNARKRYKKVS